MTRTILVIWFSPLIFMGIAFYVLINSSASIEAKIVFSIIPFLIWVFGGVAIFREYRDQEKEYREEDEVLQEAKRILDMKNHNEEKRR